MPPYCTDGVLSDSKQEVHYMPHRPRYTTPKSITWRSASGTPRASRVFKILSMFTIIHCEGDDGITRLTLEQSHPICQ